MNQLNPLGQPPPLQSTEKTYQQHTQHGTNQVNVTEHNTAVGIPNLTGHLLPPVVWNRWFIRWVGCFTVGAALPFLMAALPPLGGILVPLMVLVAMVIGFGYAQFNRQTLAVALVGAAIAIIAVLFALVMLANQLIGG